VRETVEQRESLEEPAAKEPALWQRPVFWILLFVGATVLVFCLFVSMTDAIIAGVVRLLR
jgi:hypothetical protein